MKSIFAYFRKNAVENKAPQTSVPETRDNLPSLQHSFGNSSSDFIPKSKTPLVLSALLVIGLGVFGYQYLHHSNLTDAPSFPTPKIAGTLSSATLDHSEESIASARKLFENKKLDESIETYLRIVKKKPNDAEALNDLGVLYLKKQAFEKSESHLKRSIDEDPNCAVCLNNLGYLKTLQGDSATAESLLKKALALNSSYIDPYFNLGVLYEKNGDFASSAAAYHEFITRSKEPNSPFNLKLKQHINNLRDK